jgi:hypothetical protein
MEEWASAYDACQEASRKEVSLAASVRHRYRPGHDVG